MKSDHGVEEKWEIESVSAPPKQLFLTHYSAI